MGFNELEIMDLMKNIEYGWLDKNNVKHTIVDEFYVDSYVLQSPNEVINNKIGVCWDQVELERYYFEENDWNVKTYFLVYYDDDKCPTHTFLTFERNNKYYWFEHAWEKFRRVHEYNSMKELLFDIRNKFIISELNNHYDDSSLFLIEYAKPKFGISVLQFYKHCESGKVIDVNVL